MDPYILPYASLQQAPFITYDYKIAEWVVNSVDPDQTPRYAASDQS